ncbi:MAG: response regulator [Patescibacteria group bacterium]
MNTIEKTILVVEDEETLLRLLVDEFTTEGYRVLEAKNGVEGLAIALKEHPDLILLDIIMPRLDGIATLSKLREDEWGKTARILILTNLEGDAEKTIKAIENGVFEYFVKSRWTLESLKKRVKEKLQ